MTEEEIRNREFVNGCTYQKAIPPQTMQTLMDYLFRGYPTGSFCQAVLNNNLSKALAKADYLNIKAINPIVKMVVNCFPMYARNYDAWLKLHEIREMREGSEDLE